MLHVISSRKIPISQVEVSCDVEPLVRRALMLYPAMLRDSSQLTLGAVELAAMQAPMVIYEKKIKGGPIRYYCIGNLRTFLLAKQQSKDILIYSRIIQAPRKADADEIALMLMLSEKSCFLLEPSHTRSFLITSYDLLHSRGGKEGLTKISPAFDSRTSFLESYGLNRRV